MNILSSLNSGFTAAANGTATIYERGSSAYAQWYRDYEGSDAATSGETVDLDAYGSAEVYVDQPVRVVVKDSSGATVRDYIDGSHDHAVEVISPAFTGTDYDSAESALSKPTTLGAVLDLWTTVHGTTDWALPDSGVVNCYNVKEVAYGAVGDGATDDTAAIEAAIAAAEAAGGGTVCIPAGTYRVTDEIQVPPHVHLAGQGPQATIIEYDAADNDDVLTFAGDVTDEGFQEVRGIRMQVAQASTGSLIKWTNARLCIRDCHFDGTDVTADGLLESDTYANTTSFKLMVDSTQFYIGNQTGSAIRNKATTDATKVKHVVISRCRTTVISSWQEASAFSISPAILLANEFDLSNTTENNITCCAAMTFGGVAIGNRCLPGDEDVPMFFPPTAGTIYRLTEAGNLPGYNSVSSATGSLFQTSSGYDTVASHSLREQWIEVSAHVWASDHTLTPQKYGVEFIHWGSSPPTNINLNDGDGIEGQRYSVVIHAENAGSPNWSGGATASGSFTVASGYIRTFEFVCYNHSGTRQLVQVSDSGDIQD